MLKKIFLVFGIALLAGGAAQAQVANPLLTSQALVNGTIKANGLKQITGPIANAAFNSFYPIFSSMGYWDNGGAFHLNPNALPQVGSSVSVVSTPTLLPVNLDVSAVVQLATPAPVVLSLPAVSNWPSCQSLGIGCPVYRIKDGAGNALTYPIVINGADGALIDGNSTEPMQVSNGAINIRLVGTKWVIQ